MVVDFILPFVVPPYWIAMPTYIQPNDRKGVKNSPSLGVQNITPLKFKFADEDEWWTFPVDPVVAINGRNKIIKKDVLKVGEANGERRGSVKELWTQGDFENNISGVFINLGDKELPSDDLYQLQRFCIAREAIEAQCALFTLFNIQKIVIEEYQLPFTRGERNQMFSLRALSDDYDESMLFVE